MVRVNVRPGIFPVSLFLNVLSIFAKMDKCEIFQLIQLENKERTNRFNFEKISEK